MPHHLREHRPRHFKPLTLSEWETAYGYSLGSSQHNGDYDTLLGALEETTVAIRELNKSLHWVQQGQLRSVPAQAGKGGIDL